MNYELAKKLKEAGFPQHEDFVLSAEEVSANRTHPYDHRVFDLSLIGYPKSKPDYYDQGKWRSTRYFNKKYLESEDADILYFPTLSELIEECGTEFNALHRLGPAFVVNDVYEASDKNLQHECRGVTPEEAVTNLWLALNKPNETNQ